MMEPFPDAARRRIVFVPTLAAAPGPRSDTTVVVLDTSWTPCPGDRSDLVSARSLLGAVVERVDFPDDALRRLDAWGDASAVADRLEVEGVTYWFRLRETMWRWLHERLLWYYALRDLDPDRRATEVRIPAGEAALADVAGWLWSAVGVEPEPAPMGRPGAPPPAPRRRARRFLRRLLRTFRGGSPEAVASPLRPTAGPKGERRATELAERVRSLLARDSPRVIVLTNPTTYQRVGGPTGALQDPLFGAIIPRLEDAGIEPVLVGPYMDHRADADWALLETDRRLVPWSLLRTRWSRPEDTERAKRAVAAVESALAPLRASPLDIDGIDLSPPFVDALTAAATAIVRAEVHALASVERFIAETRPRAIVLAQEGIRTPWLMAGRRRSVPVFAVQHGLLYAGHAGYPNRPHRALIVPTRTFVWGEYERDVLLGRGAYRPEEVEVVGSPRLDLDAGFTGGEMAPADRAALRRELGVADGDRLLVVSSVNLRFVQRSHFVHTLARVLGGPLPGVHVVFKQHPGEFDEGPYRDLLVGLALAGGYDPPTISVVKDVDLYRLLRAADAHLGALSTVLTEAVAVGTPNLIATVDAHADLLDYVEAGVARPVRSPDDVRAALADPRPPDRDARAAFLARHVRPGDASGRIVSAVRQTVGIAEGVA